MINLEWTQLLCGISQPILEKTLPKITYVKNWFMEIREFLRHVGGSITIQEDYQPHKLLRLHDNFIMEKMIEYTTSNTILETLNRVRTWTKVAMLAEISTVDGLIIERKFWMGN